MIGDFVPMPPNWEEMSVAKRRVFVAELSSEGFWPVAGGWEQRTEPAGGHREVKTVGRVRIPRKVA